MEAKHVNGRGYWRTLEDCEIAARVRFIKQSAPYEKAFSLSAEAGVHIPFLGRKNQNSDHLKLAALFLKRVLNDLRCVWLLVSDGYTSQAASLAATLFETTHVVKLIANDETRVNKFQGRVWEDKLPWTCEKMCKELAKDEIAKGESKISFEELWKIDYGQYRWLCEMKHTTLRVAMHDAGSTDLVGSFAVMAAPDIRDEYSGMKKVICILSLTAARGAIEAFARSTGVEKQTSDEKKFRTMMDELDAILTTEVKNKGSLNIPFGLKDTVWGKENLRPLKCLK